MAQNKNILESVREEDFVEYFLFPKFPLLEKKEEESMINSVLREANIVAKKYSQNYLWHRDSFQLISRTTLSNFLCNEENRESLPAHLYGISHYGENIEDEWFIVYLLIKLTKEIEGLIARVSDIDGEFLLIEAAEYLPDWAKPENCENRVYIYQGKIHIVAPLENEEDQQELKVAEALKEIWQNPSLTVASNEIQAAVNKKICEYPGKIAENLHRAKAYVPVNVAAILKHKPNLVAAAVQAFCNRDTVDAKACRAMKYFPPENRVNTSVVFTKCLYAMLTHTKYIPDRKTGWNLPQPSSPQYKAYLLGVKIACGFEILISQAKPTSDVEGDKAWNAYLNSLKDKNYFRGLLEHSKEYEELMGKAKEYYINERDSMQYSPAVGQEILELTKNLDVDCEEMKKQERNLPDDDNEDWLNVSPEELDKMLQERYGHRNISRLSTNSDANNFSKKITSFLEHVSDVDGAEFPEAEMPPVRPPRANKTAKTAETNNINFDANSFSCAVQNILSFVIPDDDTWDLESDSSMDDYDKDEEPPMDYGELKEKMQEYMKQMDEELSHTTIGKSFTTCENKTSEDSFDDIEDFKPVDIDMNALKNIIESYKSQMGEAGPSSNMLGPMGIHLDNDDSN